MYAPDPNAPDAADKLRSWHKKGIRGCGELKVCLNWDSQKLDPLLECVEELKIPLIFHMEGNRRHLVSRRDSGAADRLFVKLLQTGRLFGIPRRTLELIADHWRPIRRWRRSMQRVFPGYLPDFVGLEERLRRHNKLSFVGHGPLFWAGISADSADSDSANGEVTYPKGKVVDGGIVCRLLSKYDNLHADLSGPSGFNAIRRDPDFAKSFLSEYSHRILFGTDNYDLALDEFLTSLKLSRKAYEMIRHENAQRLTSTGK